MALPPTPLRWEGRALGLLDQTLLPSRVRWIRCRSASDVARAIHGMRVRGAPAIGVAAAYGVAMAARSPRTLAREAARLAAARPTAVNLAWAVKRALAAAKLGGAAGALAEAKAIHAEDREMCRRIGLAGLPLLRPDVLTYCNAGALATTGTGTATAPLYEALRRGRAPRVFACETRPLFQGSRLTAWELSRAGIDVTLLADGAAAGLLASGKVGSVFVGADRIAANGDAANKVGTLAVALAAKAHGVPFYVCAPRSTFDPDTRCGGDIRIEERAEEEVLAPLGRRAAPPGVRAWNPAFDVTPARLITAFVTDAGVLRAPFAAAIRKTFRPGKVQLRTF